MLVVLVVVVVVLVVLVVLVVVVVVVATMVVVFVVELLMALMAVVVVLAVVKWCSISSKDNIAAAASADERAVQATAVGKTRCRGGAVVVLLLRLLVTEARLAVRSNQVGPRSFLS